MSTPSLAVLIPVYNNQSGLSFSLESLTKSEGVGALTVVIVDDGSSLPVVLPEHYPFTLKLLRLPQNQGITKALNTGLEWILTNDFTYVARLDAGDVCYPQRLQQQLSRFVRQPELALLGTFARAVDATGSFLYIITPPTQHEHLRRSMHLNNSFLHPSVMMRVDVLRKVGVYSEAYPAAEDYELFFRIVSSYATENIPDSLIDYEINPSGISLSRRRRQIRSRIAIQKHYFRWDYLESYLGLFKSFVALYLPATFGAWRRKRSGRSTI